MGEGVELGRLLKGFRTRQKGRKLRGAKETAENNTILKAWGVDKQTKTEKRARKAEFE